MHTQFVLSQFDVHAIDAQAIQAVTI